MLEVTRRGITDEVDAMTTTVFLGSALKTAGPGLRSELSTSILRGVSAEGENQVLQVGDYSPPLALALTMVRALVLKVETFPGK